MKSYSFPLRDALGRRYIAGFALDVTEDREAERHLRNHQESLEAANRRLHALAVTDALTNLPNRRAFEISLDREYALAKRHGQSLSLLLIDIDDFKLFNDNYGHHEGDRVLRHVAGVIARSFRSTDSVARYGGEEFAVILPNTPEQSAIESAERMRVAVSRFEDGRRPVTVSIGVASFDGKWTQAELVRIADEALYTAKRAGKNSVCAV